MFLFSYGEESYIGLTSSLIFMVTSGSVVGEIVVVRKQIFVYSNRSFAFYQLIILASSIYNSNKD